MNKTLKGVSFMETIPKEPMSYKQYKKENELVTKLRLIRRVILDGWTRKETAEAFSCHRNTVSYLVKDFEAKISSEVQEELLTDKVTIDKIVGLMKAMEDTSTRPLSHPREASEDQRKQIKKIFEELKVKVGVKRMKTILGRKYHDSAEAEKQTLTTLGIRQLRTIYRKEGLEKEKAKATNGSYHPLYDYEQLACFERMHFDTKHILDKKALPKTVYEYFSDNQKEIPRYEWNLIDAKSRFRFLAYSYDINATFGLYFLLFSLGCIRTLTNNWDISITIGQDNGSEFCSGSQKKAIDWNSMLKPLNASIYQYNPYWDIRKNLIERSHRTDDEELFIPRGEFIHTKEDFLKETTNYKTYWNTKRSHSGKGMNGRTPLEVLLQTKLIGAMMLDRIPVLILDKHIYTLQECVTPLLFAGDIAREEEKTKFPVDQKKLYDLKTKYLFTHDAQNVLTYYHQLLCRN